MRGPVGTPAGGDEVRSPGGRGTGGAPRTVVRMDLRLPGLRWFRSLRPRGALAAGAAVVVLAGAGTYGVIASDEPPSVRRADRVMTMGDGVRIDTSYFTAGPAGR